MVVGPVTVGSRATTLIVCTPRPGKLNEIVSAPGLVFAWRIAQRNEPGLPSSLVLVTWKVDSTQRSSSRSTIGPKPRGRLTVERRRRFLDGVRNERNQLGSMVSLRTANEGMRIGNNTSGIDAAGPCRGRNVRSGDARSSRSYLRSPLAEERLSRLPNPKVVQEYLFRSHKPREIMRKREKALNIQLLRGMNFGQLGCARQARLDQR